MRAWMEGLTEADRKHHLRGFSFDELTAHDPILLWQKFFARDRLYHYEDDEDDPPFRFDEETGGEEESGGGEEESGEEETGETGETGAETEATKEEPVAAERPKAEQLAAALEGIAGEEDAVEAWWVGQQERARTQQTVYIAAASLGGLLHLPFDEVRQREPVALWSDYSRRPEQPEQPEPDDPDDELFNEQPEPEDETEQPTAAEREQIKQDLIGVIATLIYDRRVDLTYADMRAVISAISTQVDVWRVLFADDPNEPDDDEPDPEPPTPPKPKPGGGDGGAGVDGDVRARHTVQANEQGNAQPTKAEADVGKNARAPSGENEAGVVPATESTTPLTERERQWQAKLVAMLRKIQDSPDGLAKSYIPKGILTALEKDRLIRAWGQRWNITYHGREWLDQRLTEDEYRALRAIQDNSAADNPVSVFVMSRGLQQRGLIEGNLRDHHLTELGQKRLAEYSTYAPAAKTESASS
jgi:hypothetical protein